MKALHATSKKANTTMASKKGASAASKKDEIWKKKVGRRVKVAGVGFGSLVYYGETTLGTDDDGNPISCGVNLEDDLGNCDGTAPDGTQYFDCDEGFGIFTSTNDVTVVDENGVAVKAKKKAPAKKKFDSPPSLRKKINRGGPAKTAGAGTGAKKTGTKKKKAATTDKTLGALETRKRNMKKGSADAPTLNPDCLVERKILRKPKPAKAAAPAEAADGAAAGEATEEAKDDDDRPAFNAPADWIEAKKQAEAERLAEEAIQRELADKEAQEARMREMEKKLALEQERMAQEAEEEAIRRETLKAEREAKRAKDAQERADKREEREIQSMTEILEAKEQTSKAQDAFAERTRKMEERRAAQKARIAALMARVKPVS